MGRKWAEKSGLPATGLKRWRKRVTSSSNSYYDCYGNEGARGDLVVRMRYGRTRKYVPLLTTDLGEAAKRAQQFHWDMKSSGWDAAMRRLLPSPPSKETPEHLTVGSYFDHVQSLRLIEPHTLVEYRAKMRTLVAFCMKIEGEGREKWIGESGPTPWQKRVESVKLTDLTPDLIRDSMLRYRSENSNAKDHLSDVRAKHSINSLVRCARAAFSRRKIVPNLRVPYPAVLPFDGVTLFKEDVAEFRFVKEINPQRLISAAVAELKQAHPVAFLAFLLCIGAGLRRNEADKLRWMDVQRTEGGFQIEVARSPFLKGKSRSSLRKIAISGEFYQTLASFRGQAGDEDFVLSSTVQPKLNTTYRHYRCAGDFKFLCGWLQSKGLLRDKKRLHTLRKLFGDNRRSEPTAHPDVSSRQVAVAPHSDICRRVCAPLGCRSAESSGPGARRGLRAGSSSASSVGSPELGRTCSRRGRRHEPTGYERVWEHQSGRAEAGGPRVPRSWCRRTLRSHCLRPGASCIGSTEEEVLLRCARRLS